MEPKYDPEEEDKPSEPLPQENPEVDDLGKNVPAKAKETYKDFEKLARKEGHKVHSYDSLEASRNHMKWLFQSVPEYKQVEIGMKIAQQEIDLQESIRMRDYSDSELTGKLRRFLVIVVPVAFVGFLLILILVPIGAAIWDWKINQKMYDTVADLTKICLVAAMLSIIAYFFPRRGD